MLVTSLMFHVFAFEVSRIFETEFEARQFFCIRESVFGFCKWFCKILRRVFGLIFRMVCCILIVLWSQWALIDIRLR